MITFGKFTVYVAALLCRVFQFRGIVRNSGAFRLVRVFFFFFPWLYGHKWTPEIWLLHVLLCRQWSAGSVKSSFGVQLKLICSKERLQGEDLPPLLLCEPSEQNVSEKRPSEKKGWRGRGGELAQRFASLPPDQTHPMSSLDAVLRISSTFPFFSPCCCLVFSCRPPLSLFLPISCHPLVLFLILIFLPLC